MKEKCRTAKATLDSSNRAMLSIPQVCARLNCGYGKVWQLIHDGKLRAAKIGTWRIDPVDLEAFIEAEKQAAHGPTVKAAIERAFDADDHLPPTEHSFA